MSTDVYPQEEGAVFDANSYIVPAYPDNIISEVSAVKPGTTVAGRISVDAAAAIGDGYAIALKAATAAGAPSRIPILLFGIVKLALTATHTAVAGSMVMNDATPTTFSTGASIGSTTWAILLPGTSHVIGITLQAGGGATAGRSDEILVLVGRCT